MPLLAAADEPLSDEMVKQLAFRCIVTSKLHLHGTNSWTLDQVIRSFPQTSQRKLRSFRRWRIWQGQIAPFVKERCGEIYETKRIADAIKKHVTNIYNPARDLIPSVCQVYKETPQRSISKAGKKKGEALHRLFQRTKIDRLAPEWTRIAYFVGPVLVLPRASKERTGFDVMLPHDYDVVLNEDDPQGPPVAVAFQCHHKGSDLAIFDASGWRYFKTGGMAQLGTGTPEELPALHKPWPKDSPKPYVILRLDVPMDIYDWHNSSAHERIVDGSIEVGLVAAQMGHVRKAQNKRLLRVQGNTSQIPKGQNSADPEGALIVPAKDNSPIDANTLDFDTPPEHFAQQIRLYYEVMAESTGVPIVSLTSQNGAAVDVEFSFDGLTEIRNAQIPHCRDFDKELAIALCHAARTGSYDEASSLPSEEEIRKGYRVDFGKLSRRFDDPVKETQYKDWEIKYGLTDPLELLRPKHPEASGEELEAIWREHLERTSEWNDEITKRNMASDQNTGGMVTAAQANGALGPKVKNSGGRIESGSGEKPKPEQ
jgi:hypothetical protein